MIAEANYTVQPDLFIVLWAIWVYSLPMLVLAATVTALKGLRTWLIVGFLTLGLAFLYSAFRPATPDSPWSRWAAKRRGRRPI